MQAVVFDMDGLMIDSEKIYWAVGREMAREFGKTISDDVLGNMMGRAPLESVAIYGQALGLSHSPRELLEIREARVEQAMMHGIEPMPGLYETLQTLSSRFKLAIATSAPSRFLNVVLDQLKIRDYFAALQTSDDIVRGKPDPEIYLKVIRKLGLTPPHCFVLEDSSNGARAGKNAGAYVIAVPSEQTRKQDFSFVNYVAENLMDAAMHLRTKTEFRPK